MYKIFILMIIFLITLGFTTEGFSMGKKSPSKKTISAKQPGYDTKRKSEGYSPYHKKTKKKR